VRIPPPAPGSGEAAARMAGYVPHKFGTGKKTTSKQTDKKTTIRQQLLLYLYM
jgi:hypothetical protein